MTVTGTNTKSALAETLASQGGVLGEYAGIETASRFGGSDAEFVALTTGCGIYDLGWRAKIAVSGEDRGRWLNGMLTNNVKDLKPDHGNYNFLLNAQGRIQGDMYVYNRGERLLVDTERSQTEHLMKTLAHFIIMDDVELADVSEAITSIGVQGPKSEDVLKAVGMEADCANPLVVCDVKWHGRPLSITRMASDEFQTYEIWLGPEDAPALWNALNSCGATPVGTEALEKFRVVAGVPKFGTDIRERDLPQETQQDHALNFTKGCYIGQEIVERIRSRGKVHRTFTGFEAAKQVSIGTKVTDPTGKEVGEITSSVSITANSESRTLALGYVRREAMAAALTANGVAVKPATLPFKL